jgi:hypothetical protein
MNHSPYHYPVNLLIAIAGIVPIHRSYGPEALTSYETLENEPDQRHKPLCYIPTWLVDKHQTAVQINQFRSWLYLILSLGGEISRDLLTLTAKPRRSILPRTLMNVN